MTAPEPPAAVLRRAADLMRERAEGCEPRRWFWRPAGERAYPQQVSSEGNVALIAETFISPEHRPYEAEHIASWHPLVALAVATLLEDRAAEYDQLAGEGYGITGAWFVAGADGGDPDPHITLARLYLGEETPAGEATEPNGD